VSRWFRLAFLNVRSRPVICSSQADWNFLKMGSC